MALCFPMKKTVHVMWGDWLFSRICKIKESEQPLWAKLKNITNQNRKRFELFVGSKSDKNIYLYQKLRYNIYETIKYECGDIENFYMEKRRP